MSAVPPPPPRGHYSPSRVAHDGYQALRAQASGPVETHAPTLGQFWRSDSRVLPGRRRPRWAGLIAFWVGLLAVALFVIGMFGGAAEGALTSVAASLSAVAGFFALVALVAGVGRGLGFFGGVLALLGNAYVWAWVSELVA